MSSMRPPIRMGSDLTPVDPPDTPSTPGPSGPSGGVRPPGTPPESATLIKSSRYQSPENAAIEIVGVCRFSDDSVECWAPDGTPDKLLANMVKTDLQSREGKPDTGAAFTFHLGRKNRVAVVKTTMPGRQIGAYFALTRAGDLAMSGAVAIPMARTPSWNSLTNYEMLPFSESVSHGTTNVQVTEFSSLDSPKAMECKVGAKATVAGASYAIKAIRRKNAMQKDRIVGSQWQIDLKVTGPGAHPLVMAGFLDSSGDVVRYVDSGGSIMPDPALASTTSPSHYVPIPFQANVTPGATLSILTNLNPSNASKLVLRAVQAKPITLKDVAVDPTGPADSGK